LKWFTGEVNWMKKYYTLAIIIIAATVSLWPLQAEAGIWDRMKDIYNAPEQLEEFQKALTEEYERMQTTVDKQKAALEETREEAKAAAERFEAEQQMWLAENERIQAENKALQERNQQLTERLENLEAEQSGREALTRKLIMIGLSAIGMLFGYFILMRLFRFLIWKRQKSINREI
jgi:peptidoglycan hydrolase CwlO-like protein